MFGLLLLLSEPDDGGRIPAAAPAVTSVAFRKSRRSNLNVFIFAL